MTFITHGFLVSVVSDVRERVPDLGITFALYVKNIFITWVCKCVSRIVLTMRRIGPKKSCPRYISPQKISTLFDALDEREIVR
jgi:hypothetical protein